MRLTERSMLTIANDLRAADLRTATDERRRHQDPSDDPRAARSEAVLAHGSGRLTGLRRLIPGGGHA